MLIEWCLEEPQSPKSEISDSKIEKEEIDKPIDLPNIQIELAKIDPKIFYQEEEKQVPEMETTQLQSKEIPVMSK